MHWALLQVTNYSNRPNILKNVLWYFHTLPPTYCVHITFRVTIHRGGLVLVCPGRDAIIRINYQWSQTRRKYPYYSITTVVVVGIYNNMLYGYRARTVITHAAVLKIRWHLCPRYVTFCHPRTTNRDCFSSIHSFSDYIIIIRYIIPSESCKTRRARIDSFN